MHGSRGGTGGLNPLKNHKFIEFLSNTGPDPMNITKLPNQHAIWAIIGAPAKRHFNCLFLVVFGASLP